MSHDSSTLRSRQALALLTLMIAISGCTLDFDDFTPYTEENLNNRNKPPEMDMEPPPVDVDMIPVEPDMLPPDMDPPPLDGDGDGVVDGVDNCPTLANVDQRDTDMNGVGDACDDADADGVQDYSYDSESPEPYAQLDNCLGASNPDQSDLDWDGEGDACDLDADGDGLDVTQEEELGTDPLQSDSDYDGWRDDQDYCPRTPSRDNRDLDGDGYGDDCDADDDADGVYDWLDSCPFAPDTEAQPEQGRGAVCATDADSDGLTDDQDPCPFEPNVEGRTASCTLAVQRWGYEGEHYDLEQTSRGELLSATQGGLRVLSPAQEGPSSWGEEDGLPSRDVRRVVATDHPHVSAWVLMEGTRSLGALRWDSSLSQYFVIEVSLDALGVNGTPQALSAYQGSAWVGTDQGLYQLDSEGASEVTLGATAPAVTALYTASNGLTLVAAGVELFLIDSEGAVSPFGSVAELGEVQSIQYFNAGRLALLGAQKSALIALPEPAQSVTLLNTYDYVAYDIIERPDGLYFATAEGLIYIDDYGRAYEPGSRQVGGSVTRSIEPSLTEGRFWTGASGVASEHAALWNAYSIPDEPCVRDHVLAGSYWWVATPTGLYRVSSAGEKQSYGAGSFYRVILNEDGVWSANETGLIQLSGNDTIAYPYPEGVSPPIRAIEQIGDQMWIGGTNGVAYATIEGGLLGAWSALPADGEGFPYGQVMGINAQGDTVWVAVAEDPINGGGGLARYDTTLGSFINPPYTVDNGGITSHTIFDMDIYGDIIALASNIGARVIGFLEAPSFSNIALNSGLPPAAGSSHIQSLALTSSYLYLSLKPTPDERQPYGALARFTHDVEGQNPIDFTSAQLYASADTDVLTVPEADLVSTRLHDLTSPNDYVQLSYSSCGSEAYPGLVGLLDGEAGLYQRVEETRLKTSGDTNVLIPSPGEHLTWAQSYQGEGDIKVYLTDLADEYPDPYQLRDPLPRRAVQALNRAVKMCQRYELTGNPGQYSVECLLEENYYASNLNESWNVNPNPLFDGIPTDIRSFIVDGDKPATVRWYATDRGLIRRTNNTVFDEGYVIPGYGVGAPEITNLYAVHHSLFHNLLFVGSDQGVHYSPTANGGVTQQLWTPIDALKGVKVYGIAEGPAGALWVASARGLVKVTLAEGLVSEVSYYGAEQGLPTGKVERVAVSAEGYVFALHQSGLSLYRDGVWTHYGPRRGATQGATQLMLTEGYAWVGGPHGVTRFSY